MGWDRRCLVFVAVVAAACGVDEVCADGVDNDDDGLVDCDDAECFFDEACDDCGNGVVDPGEQCDVDEAWCVRCSMPNCGDGLLSAEFGEECDPREVFPVGVCNVRCQVQQCGNGRIEASEECDDGNTLPNDRCSPVCRLPVCGNLVNEVGEDCDGSPGCPLNCIYTCGDGVVSPLERCDDGNTSSGDGCSDKCAVEVCGDGIVTAILGEECDVGDAVSDEGCEACRVPRCGNRFVERGEECDAGGIAGPTCTADCQRSSCGDGVVQTPIEDCDDANDNADDGCSACSIGCGNGRLEEGEECDDPFSGTCTSLCRRNICGDSFVVEAETCDGIEGCTNCLSFSFPPETNLVEITPPSQLEYDGFPQDFRVWSIEISGGYYHSDIFSSGSIINDTLTGTGLGPIFAYDAETQMVLGTSRALRSWPSMAVVVDGLPIRGPTSNYERIVDENGSVWLGGRAATADLEFLESDPLFRGEPFGRARLPLEADADRRFIAGFNREFLVIGPEGFGDAARVLGYTVRNGRVVATELAPLAMATAVVDADCDGVDELLFAGIDGAVIRHETGDVIALDATALVSGDIDGDGCRDLVVRQARIATLWLTSRGFEPGAPFPVRNTVVPLVGGLLLDGGLYGLTD
jgi:cysteine-rich repeat protein